MLHNRPSNRKERDYALRRIIYDTLVAAKAIDLIDAASKDYSAKETAKVAGLIMARNLDAFFFRSAHAHADDIFVSDFASGWVPPVKARLSKTNRERVNKLAGHIVAHPPKVYRDDEAKKMIKPLVETAVTFVQWCLGNGVAGYTGKATYYVRRLNGVLERLKISTLPLK